MIRFSTRIALIALTALAIVGCQKSEPATPAQATAQATPVTKAAPEAAPMAKKKDPPPPSPKRIGRLREAKNDLYTVKVSDIELSAGETRTVTVEVHPQGTWAFNTEYPVKVELGGATVSTPSATSLRSNSHSKAFAITSGGMRVDVPFAGEVPGEDTVTAKLKFGLCDDTTCRMVDRTIEWQVAVR